MIRERLGNVLSKVLPRLLPHRVQAHYMAPSLVFSAEDDVCQPGESLISLALDAIQHARDLSFEDLDRRWAETPAARAGDPYLRPAAGPGSTTGC